MILLERIERPDRNFILDAFEVQKHCPVDHSMVVHYENGVPVQLEERRQYRRVKNYLDQHVTSTGTYDYLSTVRL